VLFSYNNCSNEETLSFRISKYKKLFKYTKMSKSAQSMCLATRNDIHFHFTLPVYESIPQGGKNTAESFVSSKVTFFW
jgi:hypothetical protein